MLAFLAIVCEGSSQAAAAHAFDILPLGLADAEHTRNDGYSNNSASELNDAGQVVGYAQRFSDEGVSLGHTPWFYDGSETHAIGLNSDKYARDDGYRENVTLSMNEAGKVLGVAFRYNGGSDVLGESAWLYNGVATIAIGLTDSEHTHDDDFQDGNAFSLNDAGQIVGYSRRYSGSERFGLSAWLYNGSATLNIGLTGSEYTRDDGFRYNTGGYLNEAGQVAGYVYRFDGGSDRLGESAWFYDGTATFAIGPTGKYGSKPWCLNEAGQVFGHAEDFLGDGDSGKTNAWLYDGAETIIIGLTDNQHTRDDGYQHNAPAGYDSLNDAGQAVGHANRYNGGSEFLGLSAWLYDGATTIAIGLSGGEHTREDGYQYIRATDLNEAGQVAGYADRYNDGSDLLGSSAWVYDGATTIDIGLSNSLHTREDGYLYNSALDLNEAGQVSGSAKRYNGGSVELGRTAWIYDPVTEQTFDLTLSSRSDGYAFSAISYLGNNGLAVGYYKLYDDLDVYIGDRVFYFTVEDGLHDLGMLVEGGLGATGWESLAYALRTNSIGQILGNGELTSPVGSTAAFLLTPVIASGDFNGDGVVDAADYSVWRDGLGATYDQDDYLIWRSNYGNSLTAPPASSAAPEPAAALLGLLAVAGFVCRRVGVQPSGFEVQAEA